MLEAKYSIVDKIDIEEVLKKTNLLGISRIVEKNNLISIEINNSKKEDIRQVDKKILDLFKEFFSNAKLAYLQLVDITAVDYLKYKRKNELHKERFIIIYNLLSLKFRSRLEVKVILNEEHLAIESISKIYRNAVWYEREVWDFYGIKFINNPDMRRILTDYNFEGHPLRKDFPLSGYKEVYYDEEEKKVKYKDVELLEKYRSFDDINYWN